MKFWSDIPNYSKFMLSGGVSKNLHKYAQIASPWKTSSFESSKEAW